MKKGTRVQVNNVKPYIQFKGCYGVIDRPSWRTDNGQCYFVEFDNGMQRSYLENYLTVVEVEKEKVYITLEQVCQAKENVDKAQKDWVELLSAYQLQEALKK